MQSYRNNFRVVIKNYIFNTWETFDIYSSISLEQMS